MKVRDRVRRLEADSDAPFEFLLGPDVTSCPERLAAHESALRQAASEGRTVPTFTFTLDSPRTRGTFDEA